MAEHPQAPVDEALLSLDAIGRRCGTDKSSGGHNYLNFYERFFSSLRYERVKILEVGVFKGASLKTWERYFPHASIIGVDIDPNAQKFASERVSIERVDQSNIQDLVDVGFRHGPFDIIIDDGSHLWEHQITTLRTLFAFVKNEGFYAVEDLQTNYGLLGVRYKGASSTSCVDYLKRLLDIRVGDEQWNLSAEEDAFLRTYGRAIGLIAFCRHACLIEKKYERASAAVIRQPPGHELTSVPLVAETAGLGSPLLGITWHVGGFGDVKGSSFVNVGEERKGCLQGFALNVPPPIEKDIECKVRGPTGAWSDWVAGNAFAGTRRKRRDLSGFSVRLRGELHQNWELTLIGAFEGVQGVITAGDGEDCVSPNGVGRLRGMQLLFRPQPAAEPTSSGVSDKSRTK